MTIFDLLIWGGALLSLLGLCGLIWCIFYVAKARRAKLSEEDLRQRLKSALPLNLGSLFLSIIGLMLIIVGIFLP
ncbi:hypothetical protein [Roseobacter denitrificans]|uniref:Uncharacterized protein n=1 Tax=Roseobacter denitrificans (strain ATCC 33942 / OCh 114) TaxID=375451 RepID=Q165I1_ROSDO|nr:hypothetical protein RD1_2836 [Roseobacter denitrificans OCh 114]SFF80847.1 hypothetical protein SAMN05443635_102329 [Roseobacter denitrificans OCh 114]